MYAEHGSIVFLSANIKQTSRMRYTKPCWQGFAAEGYNCVCEIHYEGNTAFRYGVYLAGHLCVIIPSNGL